MTPDFTKMSEDELVAYLEAHPMSAPDQKFDTGWEITSRNQDGTITGKCKKTGAKHTTRRIDWDTILG